MGDVQHVFMSDIDEDHSPPSGEVLNVTVIMAGGNLNKSVLSLQIGQLDDDNVGTRFVKQAEVCVDLDKFQKILTLLKDVNR